MMDLSCSSSEDDCLELYVNSVSKLKALKKAARCKNTDDDEDDDDIIVIKSNNVPTESGNSANTIEKEAAVTNHDIRTEHKLDGEEIVTTVTNGNVINCIDDDDESDSKPNTRLDGISQNSNKRKTAIPSNLKGNISINDSIERELNDTYGDSFELSQDENDSYIVIGSPPPAKKSNTEDYEVSVKVLWKSNKVERFEIKRHETFQKVFKYFANLEGVPEDQILITKKEKRITPFDTPISIDWSIIDILDGGVVSAEIVKKNKVNLQSDVQENVCKIKIQTSDKKTLSISLKNDESFASLIKKCSNELGIPEAKIKLYFDGDLIDEEETPESLDLDEEACVDLKILK